MKKKVLAIGGWASGADMWDGAAKALEGRCEMVRIGWADAIKDGVGLGCHSGKVILAGWSLGALAAIKAAVENPGKVSGLWLFSATARMTACAGYEGADPRVIKAMIAGMKRDREGVLAGFAAKCFSPDIDSGESAEKFLENCRSFTREDLCLGLKFLMDEDLREKLPEIGAPVLEVHGRHDAIIPQGHAEFIKKSVKNCRLELLDAGHGILHSHCNAVMKIAGGNIW